MTPNLVADVANWYIEILQREGLIDHVRHGREQGFKTALAPLTLEREAVARVVEVPLSEAMQDSDLAQRFDEIGSAASALAHACNYPLPYECRWGAGYVGASEAQPRGECHTLHFFVETGGYTPQDAAAIQALAIGETYVAEAGERQHIITRVAT
jgi:hypothetical protein